MISRLSLNVISMAAVATMLAACELSPTALGGSASSSENQQSSPSNTASPTSPIYHADRKHFQGFGSYLGGYCRMAYSNESEQAAVAYLEQSVGTRITGYRPFADGLIVTFRNGFETVVWAKEIDCKDPTYDPLEQPQQSGDLMSDTPEPSGSSYDDEATGEAAPSY